MTNTVIKIGGSLGRSPELPKLMGKVSRLGAGHKILIIPGGGAFADAVRAYDQRFSLGDDTSHWMGIQAMDQFGAMIASMCPLSVLVKSLSEAEKSAAEGRVPVLLPHDLLSRVDELPHSWDVTSDSIAVWVAHRIKARQLILLKSVDGLFTHDPGTDSDSCHGKADLIKIIDLNQLDGCGGVDHYFVSALEKIALDVWVLNGRHPERLAQLLNKGVTKGSHLPGSYF